MSTSATFLIPALGILSVAIATPFAVAGLRAIAHRKRRRLERSRREILVRAGQEAAPLAGGCTHQRSKGKARKGADGTYRSVCRFCGAPMRRLGRGDWIVEQPEDAAA